MYEIILNRIYASGEWIFLSFLFGYSLGTKSKIDNKIISYLPQVWSFHLTFFEVIDYEGWW